jgi:hypothetical protein
MFRSTAKSAPPPTPVKRSNGVAARIRQPTPPPPQDPDTEGLHRIDDEMVDTPAAKKERLKYSKAIENLDRLNGKYEKHLKAKEDLDRFVRTNADPEDIQAARENLDVRPNLSRVEWDEAMYWQDEMIRIEGLPGVLPKGGRRRRKNPTKKSRRTLRAKGRGYF